MNKKIILGISILILLSCYGSDNSANDIIIPEITFDDFWSSRPWGPDFYEKYKLTDFYPELIVENISFDELKVIGSWYGSVEENGLIYSIDFMPNKLLILDMELLKKKQNKVRRLTVFGTWKISNMFVEVSLYGYFWDGVKFFSEKIEFPIININALSENYSSEKFSGFDMPKEMKKLIINKKVQGQFMYRLFGYIDIVGGTGEKYKFESFVKNIEYLKRGISGEDLCSNKNLLKEYFGID